MSYGVYDFKKRNCIQYRYRVYYRYSIFLTNQIISVELSVWLDLT